MSAKRLLAAHNEAPRHEAGMTLIELILAIMIISIGLTGVMSAFTAVVRNSADPMVRKQMLAIAEEMQEEIQLKPFEDPEGDDYDPPIGCARASFDDVGDYKGYSTTGVCDIDGTALPSLANYDVSIAVAGAGLGSIDNTDTLKITVTVTRGSETLSLIGWRTNYAK